MDMRVVIAVGVVGIIVISVLTYYVLRVMKGSLKIELAQKAVSSGQKITGDLVVTVKKSILADRLYIGLVGEREERTRTRNNKASVKWVEFFRDEADILADKQLPAGFQETYAFSLDAPSEAQIMSRADAILNSLDAMMDGAAKRIIQGIGKVAAATGNPLGGRKRWTVIARLETRGVDLADSERIHVSLKSAV